MKDIPIGTHFVHNGCEYVAARTDAGYHCNQCDLYSNCVNDDDFDIMCMAKYRKDKTNVIFERLSELTCLHI